jgi:molybdopterin-guanine dinucleotide biosynthesis protein A
LTTDLRQSEPIAGVLLAGGLAQRMGGGDKCLQPLGGRPILDRVTERVRSQVHPLLLNANGDPARFSAYGLPVMTDVIEGFAGPLAGVLTGLEWLAEIAPHVRWLASFPTDAPFLPLDLVASLRAAVAAGGADIAYAASDGRAHPVFGLWPVRLKEPLRRALVQEGVRKIDAWSARYRVAVVDFAAEPIDPFFNANRPEDLERAEAFLATRTDV